MAEDEYGRVLGWGEHPACKVSNENPLPPQTSRAEFELSSQAVLDGLSPCQFAELPQSQMEPVLLKEASHNNFQVRFSTELVDVEELPVEQKTEARGFRCKLHDLISGHQFVVRANYLFGADGARSHVARSLGTPFSSKPSGGRACNILLQADLSHLMIRERQGGLHWILKPDRKTFFGSVAHLRMVRPWTEWVLVGFNVHGENPFEKLTPESPELVEAVREFIGDDSVDVKILRIDPWTVRESVADRFDKPGSNVFLLGDAAHRHPPAFGLGSNTCVQDAYNLAWKVAYVSRGLAGPELLQSYSTERQPVGAMLVHMANEGIRAHARVWESVGMMADTREEGAQLLQELAAPTETGAVARARLHQALETIGYEIQSLGICYNQWYDESRAIFASDEVNPRPAVEDVVAHPQVSTFPGSRLPHAWLDVPQRCKLISTLDLAGKGAFCLLLGEGGQPWREAAARVAITTGIPINVYGIGFGLDFIDINREWIDRRGVGEQGCVLVRPDRFVAWRAPGLVPDCEAKLASVFNQILFRDGVNVSQSRVKDGLLR